MPMSRKDVIVFDYCLFELIFIISFDLCPSNLNMSRKLFLDSRSFVGSISSILMSSRIFFSILRWIDVCFSSLPGFSGVGNLKFSPLCSFSLDFMSSFTYMCVSSGSCSSLSAAASMGRICFVSSGLRICNSASLVWFLIECGKSIWLAIRILILLL